MRSLACFWLGHRFGPVQTGTHVRPYYLRAVATAVCHRCARRYEAVSEGHGIGEVPEAAARREAVSRLMQLERGAWQRLRS